MKRREDGAILLADLIRYADHHKNFVRDRVDEINSFFQDYEYITLDDIEDLTRIYEENDVQDFIDGLG